MPVGEIAAPIALAVLKVVVVALVGYALARRGILHSSALADISALVIKVTVPCLIFANAAGGFTALSLASSLAALAAGPVVLGFGCLSGIALGKLAQVQPGHWRAVVAASTFQNSAYLPIAVATSVLPALANAFPGGMATAPAVHCREQPGCYFPVRRPVFPALLGLRSVVDYGRAGAAQ